MSRIDLPPQPNGYKVQWSYLPKQFSAENIEEILDLFRKFVPTGDFTLGKPVREFEEKFAAMIGTRHAIGVNSGTDAIKLGAQGAGRRTGRRGDHDGQHLHRHGRRDRRAVCPSGLRRLHRQFLHGREPGRGQDHQEDQGDRAGPSRRAR